MDWMDIACIVFVCTAVNHLGLIGKLEEMLGKLPILDCPKCLTCWSVLVYELWCVGFSDIPTVLAISFLCSYLAIWLNLLMYAIDTLNNRIYGIIKNNDDKETRDEGDDEGE